MLTYLYIYILTVLNVHICVYISLTEVYFLGFPPLGHQRGDTETHTQSVKRQGGRIRPGIPVGGTPKKRLLEQRGAL